MYFPFSRIILWNCEQTLPDNTKEFSHGSAKADSHERLARSGHALWANTTGMRISALGLTAVLEFQRPNLKSEILLEDGRSFTYDLANLLLYLLMLLTSNGVECFELSLHVGRNFLFCPWNTPQSTCCLFKQVKYKQKSLLWLKGERKSSDWESFQHLV